MVFNFNLCRSWIQLASEDYFTAIDAIAASRRGIAVYHVQQSVEKLCKGLLAFFGREPRANHFPSGELSELLRESDLIAESAENQNEGELSAEKTGNSVLLLKNKTQILEIVLLARSIEDEMTRPRYGIRHASGIVLPQEIYTDEQVSSFLEDLRQIAKCIHDIFSNTEIIEAAELIGEIQSFLQEEN
ncbi:MAG TPA: HEPN domain-containing protein [Candidatus Lokiarchaeia archaeon]|nr:HEPN domain-containing protein [Candidatus Lokiarchaeia archaeon]